GFVEAVLGLADPVRSDAATALARLREEGWTIGILSGDHPRVVESVARQLGFDPADARGGLTPEDKVEIVSSTPTSRHQPVVMVGDGVNDAAAMAAATVGVGVRSGAEATLAACDIYLTREGLGHLADLVVGARRTFGVIRRNLLFSLAYNAVGATLAITGAIGPLTAAILMPASSITVIVSSYRSRTFESTSTATTRRRGAVSPTSPPPRTAEPRPPAGEAQPACR
ncbi:MAG: cation-translocating P-type ATPase, partial [Planctomycetes bacterium]|nr:cation-translocating P-type ATPase [Planctomycetota bacterium]